MRNEFEDKLEELLINDQDFFMIRRPQTNYFELRFDEKGAGKYKFYATTFDSEKKLVYNQNTLPKIKVNKWETEFELALKENNETQGKNAVEYKKLIKKTVDFIRSNSVMNKIVVSRIKEYKNTVGSVLSTLKKLHENYPLAYVYLWYSNTEGVWIGASPEKLLKEKDSKLETISLAGTKQKTDQWTEKEYQEQQIVTDYIIENLKELKEVLLDGPKTIDAGLFDHLKTNITGKITEGQTIFDFLYKLHPTPAVCGVPKLDAMNFIKENEEYDRLYYTGYFGWVDDEGSEFFVNLRCAQLFKNKIRLYMGGGIIAESNPQLEWEETEMKSKTLINFFS